MKKYGTAWEVLPSVDIFTVLEYRNVTQKGFILKKLSRYNKTNTAIFVQKPERGVDL